MRNFFTSLLGTLAALIVFCTGLFFFGLVLIIVIAGASQKGKQTRFEPGSYIVFNLDTNIVDAPQNPNLDRLLRGDDDSLQLRAVTAALRSAAKDSRIAGVLLTGSLSPAGYGSSFASLKELRAALLEVRAAGKPVKGYITDASTRDYYLYSVADDLAIDPFGVVLLPGLASRPMFYTGAFEKFGIGVQVTRVGKYKSAVEPFTRKDLSPENREQLGSLLGDIWADLIADMAKSRGLKSEDLQRIADNEALLRAETAKKEKLVDRVVYRDQIVDDLKAKTGRTGSKESFKQVSMAEYLHYAKDTGTLTPGLDGVQSSHVAVVYAEGEIVDGEGDEGQIGGVRFAREIRRLRQDDNVKAIVLRVNSPGGSASASENIQREIRLAREKKPVVVSMGGYAASGGYWISAYGSRIFAEPTTITGSIGVFGIFFDVEKLSQSVGLSFDSVKTARHADALTITRPKTEAELQILQGMVDWVYDEFVEKVVDARKIKKETVQEIAQGRVWSGKAALQLKLVDELGGLDAAIRYAGRESGLGTKPKIVEYPRKKELAEVIGEMIEKVQPSTRVKGGLVTQVTSRLEEELSVLKACNDPRGVYARLPLGLKVE